MPTPLWKHVTVLLATLLAFGASMLMLQRAVGPASPWMALMLMLCFLGLAKVAEPIYVLKVPARLRRIRPWELPGRLYRSIAVPEFGALLKKTPLRVLNLSVYVSRNPRDPLHIYRQIESAEASHFWASVLLMPYLVFCAWSGKWLVLGSFLIVQIVGNAYPIMHLRSVRGRLDRLRRRHPMVSEEQSRV